jgi:hypothetical protein
MEIPMQIPKNLPIDATHIMRGGCFGRFSEIKNDGAPEIEIHRKIDVSIHADGSAAIRLCKYDGIEPTTIELPAPAGDQLLTELVAG